MQLRLFSEFAECTPSATSVCAHHHQAEQVDDEVIVASASRTAEMIAAATPRARLVAALAAPSFPEKSTSVEDLAQDLVLDVLCRVRSAPPFDEPRFFPWLSSTLLAAAAARRVAAKRTATADRAHAAAIRARTHSAFDDLERQEVPCQTLQPDREPRQVLREVLLRLQRDEALVLTARANAESWRAIGRRLRCSARTAARRHADALLAARRVALQLDLGAPEGSSPTLEHVVAFDAAA